MVIFYPVYLEGKYWGPGRPYTTTEPINSVKFASTNRIKHQDFMSFTTAASHDPGNNGISFEAVDHGRDHLSLPQPLGERSLCREAPSDIPINCKQVSTSWTTMRKSAKWGKIDI